MAPALLKSALQKCGDALSNTDSAAGLKSALLGNLKPKLVELEKALKQFDVLLSRAERLNLASQEGTDLLNPWLDRVKEAANYADNLLDDICYEHLRRKAESNRVAQLFGGSDGTSFAFRCKIDSKLNKFKSMAAEIEKEAAKIGFRPVDLVTTPPTAMSTDLRQIRENVGSSVVVGRDLEEDSVVRELCLPNNYQNLGLIAMVGMSGVGKTTLARKIYDNETVTKVYKQKTWIFVSRDFNLSRLLDEMLQSLTGESHNLSNTDAMEKKLRQCLQGGRYLLVLDDVWNTNNQVWDAVRSSLVRVTDGCTGSKVLVTTQSYEVARVMGAYLTHRIEVLCKEDAWALFEGKAFASKNQQQVLDLKDVGERILEKCGGLPLAINTLASLLVSMDERSQWESVDKSQIWKLSEGETKIMPWLLLSFNNLPNATIKRCFALCSVVIPKGGNFEETLLIESWIAHGFIQPSEKSDDPNIENIGQMYIKSMLAKNLLQSTEHMESGWFRMHDLMHDLALYVSKDSSLIIRDSNDLHKDFAGVEHVSIYGGNTFNSLLNCPEGNTHSTLRTLICVNVTLSIDLVAQARFLRQLDLRGCGLKKISSSIGGLKHLRILALDDNPLEYLPETIGRLYNLGILSLKNCCRLVELPQQVTKLLNLRKILTTEAVHIPKGMGQLTRLTKLPVLKLKAGDGGKITELGSLVHLKGEVHIEQLENISSKDVANASLKNIEGIVYLELVWTRGHQGYIVCRGGEEVMEGLQPHSNLNELWVENFPGKRFSPWLSRGIYCTKLRKLCLKNCKECEQLPTLGCLPFLNTLIIDKMESVEVIGSDFYACCSRGSSHIDMRHNKLFPALEVFVLVNMPKLKNWVDPSGSWASVFPCMEKLVIKYCSSLVRVPACFQSLKQLTVKGMNSGEPLLMILSNSYKLTSLAVKNVQQLTSLSKSLMNCTSLRLLSVKGCEKLVELPPTLQSLGCLETLEVCQCDSLTSLPDIEGLLSLSTLGIWGCGNIIDTPRGLESCESIENLKILECHKLNLIPDLASLSCLRTLTVMDFSKQMSIPGWTNQLSSLFMMATGGFNRELDEFPSIDHLPKRLKRLALKGWPKLKSLPNEIQSLTQLEILALYEFEGVVELPEWLGNLSSLQSLEIWYCEKMTHLPSSDAMRRLNRLTELTIKG